MGWVGGGGHLSLHRVYEVGGGGVVQDCCVDLLSQLGLRVLDLKPYLRGFTTDGPPLFQDVSIIHTWIHRMTAKVLLVASSLNKGDHEHPYARQSSSIP